VMTVQNVVPATPQLGAEGTNESRFATQRNW